MQRVFAGHIVPGKLDTSDLMGVDSLEAMNGVIHCIDPVVVPGAYRSDEREGR